MKPEERYFCKEGYSINNQAKTFDFSETETYWTEERIESSFRYQHHVYRLAAKIAQKMDLISAMDLGSGPGTKARDFLSPVLNEIVLVDQPSSKPLAQTVFPGANFIGANFEESDVVLDRQFDLIICADVLEHLYNPMPCLKFAFHHLAPTGIVIFSTPERDILRGKGCMSSPHPAHVREWNSDEFKSLLDFSGFNIVQHSCVPSEKLSRFEEILWVCFKCLFQRNTWNSCQVAVCTKK